MENKKRVQRRPTLKKAAQISMGIYFLATNTRPLPGCSLLIFMSVIPLKASLYIP